MSENDHAELARELAEHIIFTHATDIENLTVWEMTADHIRYSDDYALQTMYDNEDKYDELCQEVHKQIDSAVVGISWDGGATWQW